MKKEFSAVTAILVCVVMLSGCGKKKQGTDMIAELENKPAATEVASAPEPTIVDNSQMPEPEPIPDAESMIADAKEEAQKADSASQAAEQADQVQKQAEGYEIAAQKVRTAGVTAVPDAAITAASTPQRPPSVPPYPPRSTAPQSSSYSPYPGYPGPPKKYVPPGPIESAGEFIGHLVNPFKRKEDESKKEYKGI
ncbi:MAG: hypothetical protein HY586_00035 [Candidatus Omnitrophica bacterium]|nr:hypothetical protein [Candidatus Omnitrophota bacterium]